MKSIVNKPWGSFEVLEQDKKYTIKKIIVIPGGILSYQSHSHRSEHWIVAEGKAEITLENKVYNLSENQTIFIPQESKHRLANKSDKNLVIIEMWYGDKLDENDIIRYDDIYGRK